MIKKARLPIEFYGDKTLMPYLSMEYIRNNTVIPQYAKDGDVCYEGDVLLLWDGSNAGEFIFKHPMGYAPSTTAILRLKADIDNNYLKFVLELFSGELRNNTNGMGIPHVNGEFLKNAIFSIPPKQEASIIANFLDDKCADIDNIISKTQDSIDEYKKYKQAIITETVTNGLNPDVTMKESGIEYIGEIPSHWLIRRLRFLGLCLNGISKGGEAFGSGYPFVSYGDVYKNYSLPENVDGLIESTEADRDIYSVRRGDVFFTRTSETIEEVGFTSTCLKNIDNATFAGFVIRFRPYDESMLLPEYSKFYFRSEMHRRFFVKEMNLVTRASLSQELLKKLPVILPPLPEQEQIAKYLRSSVPWVDKLTA